MTELFIRTRRSLIPRRIPVFERTLPAARDLPAWRLVPETGHPFCPRGEGN
uniref:Uncharacterized protein n=1 Tax=Arundo donax TaxID=35708 RepID=A0A0A9GD81_ARUDO